MRLVFKMVPKQEVGQIGLGLFWLGPTENRNVQTAFVKKGELVRSLFLG